jgi:hypothetical protein
MAVGFLVRRESESAVLTFHIEPDSPLEVSELTDALGSLSRQYERFAIQEGMADKARDARLLIANVAPGSIIVNFIPDWDTISAVAAPMVPEAFHRAELVVKFAKRVKRVLDYFLDEKKPPASEITIKDCDDATNIVRPVAEHGGQQTFVTVNGDVHNTVLTVNAADAVKIIESASKKKMELLAVDGSKAQRVAMVWSQLARDAARTDGKKSPDRGIISEIDLKSHPIFFTDDMAGLKAEMIDNEENPYQKVFFVDVDISRVPSGGIGNYRITAFHGSDDYEPPTQETPLLSA